MAVKRDKLEELLKEGFPNAEIEVIDLAGDNNHWKAVIISPQFAGKSRIAKFLKPSKPMTLCFI